MLDDRDDSVPSRSEIPDQALDRHIALQRDGQIDASGEPSFAPHSDGKPSHQDKPDAQAREVRGGCGSLDTSEPARKPLDAVGRDR